MKQFILLFLTVLFFTLPINAIKRIEANPINVAVMLSEQTDSASIASTCEYYGYTLQPAENEYTVFEHPNGSMIRYTINEFENGTSHPSIEVTSKASQKEKNQILNNLNFKKADSGYERRSVGYTIRCTNGPHGSLRIVCVPKARTL